MISRLCAADGVGDDEIAMLAMALLFAGHETTVVQIGLGALLLLSHPDQWQALAESPDRIPDVVEEILRAPGKGGGGIPRYACIDFDLCGVTIQTGDLVTLDNGAANHDPAVFPDLTQRGSAVDVPPVETPHAEAEQQPRGHHEHQHVHPLEAVPQRFTADVVVERRHVREPVGAELAGEGVQGLDVISFGESAVADEGAGDAGEGQEVLGLALVA
ncbi:cytochrome P450, partial [Streptomyces phaeochromogenes]